jgi:hypothetical protein
MFDKDTGIGLQMRDGHWLILVSNESNRFNATGWKEKTQKTPTKTKK